MTNYNYKDYLRELGFHIDEKVSCQCIDDDEAWIGIVDRDSSGRYFLFADDVTYYPTGTDKLMLIEVYFF